MTQSAALFEQKMQEAFFQGVGMLYPGTKIYVPNAKWIEPTDQKYFAFFINNGDGFNANLGSTKFERQPIVLTIYVYCPTETYDRSALEMAEAAARIFANQGFEIGPDQNATFHAASTSVHPDTKTRRFRTLGRVKGYRDTRLS